MQWEEVHAKHGHDQTDTLKEKGNQLRKHQSKLTLKISPDQNQLLMAAAEHKAS